MPVWCYRLMAGRDVETISRKDACWGLLVSGTEVDGQVHVVLRKV